MRKVIAILTIIALMVSMNAAFAEMETEKDEASNFETLTVGSVTQLTGSFFTDMWSNSTADIDVRMLVHGYSPVCWQNETASYQIDTSVASGISVTENRNGNRTYTIVLNDDLRYSDGSSINAYDYAFSLLLSMSPEMKEIGADNSGFAYIYGSDAYMAGETEVLSGVRVLNDLMYSVTVKAEYLPFFYELSYLNVIPYPISVIAPGCEVADGGEGVYIRNTVVDEAATGTEIGETEEEPLFTAELLAATILDTETGYKTNPKVSSGPYVLSEYDSSTHTAKLSRNEYYKGDINGRIPTIENLIYTSVTNEDMIDKLENGEVDLINKVVNVNSIDKGMNLTSSEEYGVSNYSRNGLAMISFCCEQTVVSSKPVREAITMCLDKETLINEYIRNYGIAAVGYFGMGQWIYQLVNGTISAVAVPEEGADETTKAKYEAETAAWSELSLENVRQYEFDIESAQQLLIEDGWTLNKDGEEFDKENDKIRCKKIDGQIVALDLSMITAIDTIVEPLNELFVQNLAEVGINLTIKTVSTEELFRNYYHETDRDADMIMIATNFSTVYDPSVTYMPEDEENGVLSCSGLTDSKLYESALDLRRTEPSDLLGYCKKWIKFQELWSKEIPAIPLYTNVYFDFYSSTLHQYNAQIGISWSQAILSSYLGEITTTEEDDEETEVDSNN